MSITLKLSIGAFVVSQLITSADILFQLVNKLSSESKEVYKIIHVVGNHVRHILVTTDDSTTNKSDSSAPYLTMSLSENNSNISKTVQQISA